MAKWSDKTVNGFVRDTAKVMLPDTYRDTSIGGELPAMEKVALLSLNSAVIVEAIRENVDDRNEALAIVEKLVEKPNAGMKIVNIRDRCNTKKYREMNKFKAAMLVRIQYRAFLDRRVRGGEGFRYSLNGYKNSNNPLMEAVFGDWEVS